MHRFSNGRPVRLAGQQRKESICVETLGSASNPMLNERRRRYYYYLRGNLGDNVRVDWDFEREFAVS